MKQYPLALWVVLVVAFALASCSNPAQPAPTAALESTNTPETVATSTPASATTPKPTRTPEPTGTPTSTPDFYVTATAIVKAVVATGQPRVSAPYLSPDGQWRAEVIIYDCVHVFGVDPYAYEQLKIVRVNDGMERVVADQLRFCGGLGAYGLGGRFWSPNSRYFYFTDAREGVPDGGGCYWERPLFVVEAASGDVERLAPGPLSPDRTMIAMQRGTELVLWSLDDGEIASNPLVIPDTAVGAMAWSPDGQALVYLQTASNCQPFGKSSIIRLDVRELKHTLLLESETPGFIGVIWDAPHRIRLFDEQGKEWRYNFVTQELKPAP
jgi:WD40 repeat protein